MHRLENPKTHIRWGLSYLLISVVLGLLLRGFHLLQIPLTYKYIVHAHSHLALLGWVYLGLTTVIYTCYELKEEGRKHYRRLFCLTQITLVGMLVFFPIEGYGLFSIVFSTLFLLVSYRFAWMFRKYFIALPKHRQSHQCFKGALFFMVLSSLGPWVLGAIMNTLGPTSIWYRLSIYFYLHFQYNGWMFLGLLGMLLFYMENSGFSLSEPDFSRMMKWVYTGIVFSLFLSGLWAFDPGILNLMGGAGVLCSGLGLWFLVRHILVFRKQILTTPAQLHIFNGMLGIVVVKLILQGLSAFPYFVTLATTYLDFIIGYLHWNFLGVVSLGLLLCIHYKKLVIISKEGTFLFVLGFISTEALIFYKALSGWLALKPANHHDLWLWIGSLFVGLGVAVMLLMAKRQGEKSA